MRNRERQERVSVSIQPGLAEWARQAAREQHIPVSTLFSDAIVVFRREVRRKQTIIALAMNEGVSGELEEELKSKLNISADQDLRGVLRARYDRQGSRFYPQILREI